MGKTILTAKHITKLFPGMKALDDVDFDLQEGEVHILVGENGAGKSTLAKCLLGAYKPEEGEVRLDGQVVKFNGVMIVVFVFQSTRLSRASTYSCGRGWLCYRHFNPQGSRAPRHTVDS